MKKFGLWLLLALLSAWTIAAQGVPPQELADADGQFIDLGGVEIYYIERGPADGPAVLLLHGFGGSTFSWRLNMDALAEAGYRVVAFDRPPFGLSDKRLGVDYSTAAYAELTAQLMDALAIESAALVGHSAGGGVIAQFAVDFPERVAALVYVAAAVPIEVDTDLSAQAESTPDAEETENESPLGNMFALAANLDPESEVAQTAVRAFLTPEAFVNILSSAYYDATLITPEVAAGYQRPLRVEGWEGAFLTYIQTTERTAPDLDALAAVDAPVLIVWGEEDTWVPMERGEALRDLYGTAQWVTYSDIGHLPMEETPDTFNADLLEFLDSIDEASG
jgi:pimeloyl-ACP methyl ester carboxylesterase